MGHFCLMLCIETLIFLCRSKEEDQNVFVFHTKKISSGTSEVLDGATYKFHAGDAEIMSKWLKAAEKVCSPAAPHAGYLC